MSPLACSSGSSAGTGIHRDQLRLTQRSRPRDATGPRQGGCSALKPSSLIRPLRPRVLFHLSKNWISAKYGSRTLRRCIRVACSATFAKHWPPWDLACPLGDARPRLIQVRGTGGGGRRRGPFTGAALQILARGDILIGTPEAMLRLI